jgi:hypothetical protein
VDYRRARHAVRPTRTGVTMNHDERSITRSAQRTRIHSGLANPRGDRCTGIPGTTGGYEKQTPGELDAPWFWTAAPPFYCSGITPH